MSGPGWWTASDGRWYPPESHPDPAYRARWAPPAAAPPPPGMPPPPMPGSQPYAYAPAPQQGMNGCLKAALIVGAVLVALGLLAAGCVVLVADEVVNELEDQIDEMETELESEVGELDAGVGG